MAFTETGQATANTVTTVVYATVKLPMSFAEILILET